MSRAASPLPPCGPSPSELVGARTTSITQPAGASRRKRSSPSDVSAQFRDVAARSTTRRRPSVNVDAIDVLAREQMGSCDLELPRRTRQLELEGAIVRVIEDA